MAKLTITQDQACELLDGAEEIDRGKWRHGHSVRFLIECDGKHYATWVQFHHEDGMQLHGTLDLTEVVAREKVVTVWEDVKP